MLRVLVEILVVRIAVLVVEHVQFLERRTKKHDPRCVGPVCVGPESTSFFKNSHVWDFH
jgi:hypothetical protein